VLAELAVEGSVLVASVLVASVLLASVLVASVLVASVLLASASAKVFARGSRSPGLGGNRFGCDRCPAAPRSGCWKYSSAGSSCSRHTANNHLCMMPHMRPRTLA